MEIGVKQKTLADQRELRKRVSSTVLNALSTYCLCSYIQIILIRHFPEEAASPEPIYAMNYASFDTAITLRFGIVCERYLLNYFCAPGQLSDMSALHVLYNS